MLSNLRNLGMGLLCTGYASGSFFGMMINHYEIKKFSSRQLMVSDFDKFTNSINEHLKIGHKYGITVCFYPFTYLFYGITLESQFNSLYFSEKS